MESNSSRTLIIAEAGVNHNGDLETAIELVRQAKKTGADAVKFQTFEANLITSPEAPKANYQKNGSDSKETQLEMLKDLELSPKDHQALFQYCKEIGITFLSTPFHEEAVDLLDKFGVQLYKVGSGDLNNTPFLKYISSKNKPIILSTGMADMIEIRDAVKCITENQKNTPYSVFPRLTLLHCVSCYPTPFEQVNLNAIRTIREAFSLPVGFSDHTLGIEASVAAVAIGANVIEKHFTLDRDLPGPDHSSSLEPHEFKCHKKR